ncbi:hypothetical protein SDJN02_13054, partial [Cucurbita argyrosperma subsp. argyrosperma]
LLVVDGFHIQCKLHKLPDTYLDRGKFERLEDKAILDRTKKSYNMLLCCFTIYQLPIRSH